MRKKTNPFFIEMITVILFFSIALAVVLQLFAAAERRSELSRAETSAMLCLQSLSEEFKAQSGFDEPLAFASGSGSECRLYYDNNWEQSAQTGKYTVVLRISTEKCGSGSMLVCRFTAAELSGGRELYALQTQKYIPEE